MILQAIDTSEAEAAQARPNDYKLIAAASLLSAAYATLRYNVFKGVPWSDWPHYIGNKILALTALILIAAAVLRLISPVRRPIRRLMAVASALALTHTLVSLGLFEPAYFDKFFDGDKLSLAAGWSLMLAALAMALLQWGKGRRGSSAPEASIVPLGVIAFISGLHAALPSAASWLDIASWPGHMPPITLISFAIGSAALIQAWRLKLGRRIVV